jgi:SAM-dependent methyltransferase
VNQPRVPRGQWDDQYRSGRWDYLAGQGEAVRYRYLAAFARQTRANSVLDAGCGAGVPREALGGDAYQGRYVGVDWSLGALPRRRLPPSHVFVCADVGRLPLAPAFDLIVAAEVLYYLDDPGEALQRMGELLAPGGSLLVSCYQPPPHRASRWLPVVAELEALLSKASGDARPVRLVEPSNGRVWHVHQVRAATAVGAPHHPAGREEPDE